MQIRKNRIMRVIAPGICVVAHTMGGRVWDRCTVVSGTYASSSPPIAPPTLKTGARGGGASRDSLPRSCDDTAVTLSCPRCSERDNRTRAQNTKAKRLFV